MKLSLTVFCLSLLVLIAGTEGVRPPGPCEKQCTKELEYHCGSDGKTYNNRCIFEIESCRYPNLKLAHKGRCVSTASEAPPPPPPRCRKGCEEIYFPLCGSDGKTYGNECELNIANCHDSTIKLAHMGECKQACNDACPANYDPVCGSDGKTYSNACNLVAASCKASGTTPVLTQVHRGECKTCPDACITLYDPVCGNDGKTYGNSCELGIASCKDSRISQLHKGPCKSAREDQNDRDEEEEEEETNESGKRRCPTICTLEYNPVCGSNGITYSNPCGLSIAQCNDPSITLASNGRCGGGGLFQ